MFIRLCDFHNVNYTLSVYLPLGQCCYEVLVSSGKWQQTKKMKSLCLLYSLYALYFSIFGSLFCRMSDKSELKAELERKKQRIAQIREEKKRKEEEKKKKDVSGENSHLHMFLLNVRLKSVHSLVGQ